MPRLLTTVMLEHAQDPVSKILLADVLEVLIFCAADSDLDNYP